MTTTQKHHDAAGVLFSFTDEDGTWYLLTQRAKWLSFGSTWTPPGGSIDDGESALEAASRELYEELGVDRAQLTGTIRCVVEATCEKRTYSTFVVDLPSDTVCVPRRLPSETADVAWYLPEQVSELNLHPSFRLAWNALMSGENRGN